MFQQWLEKKKHCSVSYVFSVSCWKSEAMTITCGQSAWAWRTLPWDPKGYDISWRECFGHNLTLCLVRSLVYPLGKSNPDCGAASSRQCSHRQQPVSLQLTTVTSLVSGRRKGGWSYPLYCICKVNKKKKKKVLSVLLHFALLQSLHFPQCGILSPRHNHTLPPRLRKHRKCGDKLMLTLSGCTS